jgi:hypothetical protein
MFVSKRWKDLDQSVADGGFTGIADVPDNMPGDVEGLVIRTLASAVSWDIRRVIGRSFGLLDRESVQNTSTLLTNIGIHFRTILAIHVLYNTADIKSPVVKAFVEDVLKQVTLLSYATAREVEDKIRHPTGSFSSSSTATAEAEAEEEAELKLKPLQAKTSIHPQKMAEFFAKIATTYCKADASSGASQGSTTTITDAESLGVESPTATADMEVF